MSNPDYKPEPLPLTERIPWLIYVVLAVSSLAPALILFSLERAIHELIRNRPTNHTLNRALDDLRRVTGAQLSS